MLRCFDLLFAALGLLMGLPILLFLYILGLFDTGQPLFVQQRLGRNQQCFAMVKFRTMQLNTQSVATHLADANAITAYGRFLRKTKLDELPQLWNVLKGEMSLVGPRPGLENQTELTKERESLGVFSARPGITGLAQVSNIDMSTPKLLASTDAKMIRNLSITSYFKYILLTLKGNGQGDKIKP